MASGIVRNTSGKVVKQMANKLEKAADKMDDQSLKFVSFTPAIGGAIQYNVSASYDPDVLEETAKPIMQSYVDMMPQAAKALKAQLDLALRAPVWQWHNGGARDIYDTGELAASGSVEWNGKSLVINYTAPYADIVHNGGYIFPYGNKKARPIYLPGRPWISSVLDGGGPVPQWSLEKWLLANQGK